MNQTRISRRLASIDAFRAITMLLMIFVNDLILDSNVPNWLEHAREGEDRLGFADTIFPAFLFIVGLSIPLAIKPLSSQGAATGGGVRRDAGRTVMHILRRSLALLIMGFFLVNYEEYTTGPAPVSQFAWLLIITIAFFFIWLVYPEGWPLWMKWFFRGIGIAALVGMALIYKSGPPGATTWMKPQWWGILGLIGWAYLTCSLFYFFAGERLGILAVGFFYFVGFSIAASSNWGWIRNALPYLSFGNSGGLSAFTMAGVMTTVYYRRITAKGMAEKGLLRMAILVPLLLAAGFALRPLGGISKLEVSPSWIFICTGISVASTIVLAYIVDLKNKKDWYRLIRAAGTITLTCYLLPDIHFAIIKLLGEHYRVPLALRTGWIGVGKSLVFAFLIVLLTGVMEKRKLRLSI
jgi:heparan-alpha-glucosaminide N-acetyltransferase